MPATGGLTLFNILFKIKTALLHQLLYNLKNTVDDWCPDEKVYRLRKFLS